MLKVCKQDKTKVMQLIQELKLDGIAMSSSNLIDDIILSMSKQGILDCLKEGFLDKRNHNTTVPFDLILVLAIAAKMKIHTSLSDIPYAITDHRTFAELGYNILNSNPEEGWFKEGTIRHLLTKYSSLDLFNYYINVVQNYVFKKIDFKPDIHILDCTKIAVNKDNENYENATWAIDRKGDKMFGYKLASLRGLYGDSGIIEDVRFGTASTHDLELSRNILYNSPCLNEGDCLLMDRGFFSREVIDYLKNERKVDVYIPLKKNTAEYDLAIELAEEIDDWKSHPTRKNQMICHVPKVDSSFQLFPPPKANVEFNTCAIWTEETQSYVVFATTDMTKTADEIVRMYELRWEIEEDFRQLKDFWKLEDFKSTKYNVISFHLVCVLFGYLFYQLYINSDDGEKYIGKSLPVMLKNYRNEFLAYLALYVEDYFCVMSLKEFMEFRDNCNSEIRKFLLGFLG